MGMVIDSHLSVEMQEVQIWKPMQTSGRLYPLKAEHSAGSQAFVISSSTPTAGMHQLLGFSRDLCGASTVRTTDSKPNLPSGPSMVRTS